MYMIKHGKLPSALFWTIFGEILEVFLKFIQLSLDEAV